MTPTQDRPSRSATLRATFVTSVATLVTMIAVLGGLAFGVTHYQRSLFIETMSEVTDTTGVFGSLDRSLILSAGGMLAVLYRPEQGATLERDHAAYIEASDTVNRRFEQAEAALDGGEGHAELLEARVTWEALDEVVRSSPETFTDEELFALMAASEDPFVDTVWFPFERLDRQLNDTRNVAISAMEQRTESVSRLQQLFGPVVALAIAAAVGTAWFTARRVSRRLVRPLETLGASARTLHDPERYEPCDVSDAVAEVQELARVVDESAQRLHTHHERLERQALTDSMTSLPNRDAFTRSLRGMLDDPATTQVAVLFVDLDDFKHVNDTLGHAAGDELLRIVAARLQAATRECEVVARLGGDEFAVAMRVDQEHAPTAVAERIRTALAEPVELDGQLVRAGCSVGIVVSDGDDERTPDSLLGNADFAMYMAKSQGKGRYELYSAGLHTEMAARMDLARELGDAVSEEQLVLHYQPVFDLLSDRVLGFEALLRWAHPTRGLVPPDDFIPIAEENGVIVEIGAWVLDEACALLAEQRGHDGELSMSVNVSPRQLGDGEFVSTVLTTLERHGLEPEALVLEVTEANAMTSTADAASALAELRRHGVHIALDDFGSGFASLNYLGDLPADVIKIDRSFVDSTSPHSELTLESIVELAQRLGMHVVAEGVETESDLRRLRRFGDIAGQGYLFARPMSGEDALHWVSSRESTSA